MTDPQGIEVEAVTEWTTAHVPGLHPPFGFEKLEGGHSNLTYRMTDQAGRRIVIRRPPLGELLPRAHDMTREYKIITALGPTPVPVAPSLALCEDPDVTGQPFYLMDFVEGHVLHTATHAMTLLDEDQRRALGLSFADVLADLHEVVPDEVGLGDLGRKEDYIARQLNRWYGQWNASKPEELPAVDEVYEALISSIPEQGPARVVHGDYRLGNCMTAPEGRIVAVFDWEICTLGDPMADLGYAVSTWAEPGEAEPAAGAPTLAPGFQTRQEIIDRYAERSGRDVSGIDYYVAFSRWKSACIVAGVYARYVAGQKDTTGVDVDGFRESFTRSAALAAEALEGLT